MTEEFTTSTPADNANADTSVTEPSDTQPTAEGENDTNQEHKDAKEVLYAGKYKTVDELEKGYAEAQKLIGSGILR